MTTILCLLVPESFVSAEVLGKFFDAEDQAEISDSLLMREQLLLGVPEKSCKTNLVFGFFSNGAKNNYVLRDKAGNQSNFARLYD